jgi:predicted cobalt transporter CbtA
VEKRLILRGLLAGAVGGLLAFVFARIFAEPLIDRAITYEDGRDAAQDALARAAGFSVPADTSSEVFSRSVQANLGIGVGMVGFGLAMGALFAVAYTVCLGRTGQLHARSLALVLAACGFVVVYLVPFLKYPANPPAIGSEDTIRDRGSYFLLMVVSSLLAAVLATVVGQRLQARFGTWNASLLAIGGYIAVVAVVMLVLKDVRETPTSLTDREGHIVFPPFPADVLADFRVYSVAAQVVLWSAIGLIFAPLADRALAGGERPVVAPEPASL